MRLVFVCAAAMAVFSAGSVHAQAKPDVAFNIGVVSDYVFRGASQTGGDAALQGGVDVDLGGFYLGSWASNVDFGDDTAAEIDLYGGYRTEAAGYALDFGAGSYFYVNEPDGAEYNYVEFKALASRAVGPATLGAGVYHSFDYFGVDEKATYVEANAAIVPADKWTLSGAIGHQWLDVSGDYAAWNLGAAYALSDHLTVDVRYHDMDSPLGDARVAAGLKASF
ncbi:TorF family putative porin [Brevundimonas sp.]|uniref:TorF family putative porin n=1 Tax=Brevundimonas sp. TaxID=1871086 RepID=UPI002ED8DF4D